MAENPSTGEIQCHSFQKIVPKSPSPGCAPASAFGEGNQVTTPKSFIFSVLRLHGKAVAKRNVSMGIKLLSGKSAGPPRD
jgi:hypothetical protein